VRVEAQVQRADSRAHVEEFCIFIDGQAVCEIQKSAYLKCHFEFLCYFCDNLVAYDILPQQKEYFSNLVQREFPDCNALMVIGSCYSDAYIMSRANFSVQMYFPNM